MEGRNNQGHEFVLDDSRGFSPVEKRYLAKWSNVSRVNSDRYTVVTLNKVMKFFPFPSFLRTRSNEGIFKEISIK